MPQLNEFHPVMIQWNEHGKRRMLALSFRLARLAQLNAPDLKIELIEIDPSLLADASIATMRT